MPQKSPRGLAYVFRAALAATIVCFALCSNRVTAATPTFANGVTNGFVNTYDISEASGIIVSRQNPGVLWTHNDSGYRGSVMALATNGTYLARHYVPDVYSGNFEDISFGPGPIPQHQYIYLGDIGDNFLSRASIRVLRFPEPAVYYHQSNSPPVAPIFGAEEITLYYPDGARDCEGMMVDPLSGDLFLATKLTNSTEIYRATRAELNSGNPITLTFMSEISTIKSVSAADISTDGSLIIMRRANKASLWTRNANESVVTALGRSPATVPVIGQTAGEANGEAIGFDPTASSYYTISEGYLQPICYFARTSTLAPQPRVFVAPGSDWHILDSGAAPPTNWRTVTNDTWRVGPAPLGYGGYERTLLDFGDIDDKLPTTCFRKTFSASGLIQSNLALRICFNDGVAVYFNGTEILRRNLSASATFGSYATTSNTDQWRTWFSYPVPPSLLRAGTNVLAVELHRADATGSLLNFDLQLVEARVETAPRVSSVRRIGTNCIVTVTGSTDLVARIEHSADSQTWAVDRQLLLSNGSATFTNPFTPPRTFFRVAP